MDARLIIANFPGDKLEEVEKKLERMGVERINVSKGQGIRGISQFLRAELVE